jgi:hypothetical protein
MHPHNGSNSQYESVFMEACGQGIGARLGGASF